MSDNRCPLSTNRHFYVPTGNSEPVKRPNPAVRSDLACTFRALNAKHRCVRCCCGVSGRRTDTGEGKTIPTSTAYRETSCRFTPGIVFHPSFIDNLIALPESISLSVSVPRSPWLLVLSLPTQTVQPCAWYVLALSRPRARHSPASHDTVVRPLPRPVGPRLTPKGPMQLFGRSRP